MQLVQLGTLEACKQKSVIPFCTSVRKFLKKTHTYTSRYYSKKAVITRVWDPDVGGYEILFADMIRNQMGRDIYCAF